MNNLFTELKRRNLFRVAAVYAVISWLIAQMASLLESAMKMPDWFDTMVVSCLLLGFPIAMILAWAFEMTPEGVKRTEVVAEGDSITAKTGRGLDFVLVGSLLLVGVLIVGDRLMPNDSNSAAAVSTASEAGSGGFEGQSIAVLPFEDFSADKDQAYFADGIAEELLNVLARVKGLRVASRTSAFSFKERESSISEIAKALNVEHILEGSVRKAGNTLRITAQLIDTKTDEHLWSETYDRPLTAENIFEIQGEISQAIVLELNGRLDLLPETSDRPTTSTQALEAYLKGKEAYGPRTPKAFNKSLDWLGRAVTLDPDFAEAHAKLAFVYILQNVYGGLDRSHSDFRIQTHIDRAMALAPQNWEVLSEYAWTKVISDSPLEERIAVFEAAVAANPNNANAHRGLGLTLINTAQITLGLESLKKAKLLDPRSAILNVNIATAYIVRDNLNAARAAILEALRIDSNFNLARSDLAYNSGAQGDHATAYRIVRSCAGVRYCGNDVVNFYADLGMDDDIAARNTPWSKLYLLHKKGSTQALVQVSAELEKDKLQNLLGLFVAHNLPEQAFDLFQHNPSTFGYLLDNKPNQGLYASLVELSLLWTLEQAGDQRADQVRSSLKKKHDGTTPTTQASVQAHLIGARWRMAENDPDGAMEWLNSLAEKGVPNSLVFENNAWFAPLKERTDYKAFEARMLAFAKRDRALIKDLQANPEKLKWSPDEVLGGSEQ